MRILKVFFSLLLISSVFMSCSKKHIENNAKGLAPAKATFIQDSLAFELCKIYGFDQGIRDYNLKVNRKELMPKIDTLSFNRIVSFLEENGYPSERLLGEENMKQECVEAAFTAVLLHNPHRLVNEQKYFDLFFNEVKKGNLDASFFATILDKYYWANSKNRINRRVFYGSQFGKPCIQTKEATNKARMEIGLESLGDDGFVDCGQEDLNMPKERR